MHACCPSFKHQLAHQDVAMLSRNLHLIYICSAGAECNGPSQQLGQNISDATAVVRHGSVVGTA